MKLRVGYDLSYECPQPRPMMLMLNTHFSHAKDIVEADLLVTDPPVPTRQSATCSAICAAESSRPRDVFDCARQRC